MIISTHTGKIIHHNNCTHCVFRNNKNIGTKSKKRIQERCILHNRILTPPNSDQKRTCDDYTQVNCQCEACLDKYKRFDTETLLDKKDKAW